MKYSAKATEIGELELSHVSGQLDTFRKQLEAFATKHKSEIRKNAEFRGHFQQMCARIGVDPLACEQLINTFLSCDNHVIPPPTQPVRGSGHRPLESEISTMRYILYIR